MAVRIQDAENNVQRLVSEEDDHNSSRQSVGDPEVQQRQHDVFEHDGGSDDDLDDDLGDDETEESFDALEERFHGFEEEVAILVAEVHDVVLYSKLNITGFMKILKVSSLSRIIRNVCLSFLRNMMLVALTIHYSTTLQLTHFQ